MVRSFAPCVEQGVDQLVGQAGGAEAADHHGRAVGHVGHRRGEARDFLLDHVFVASGVVRRASPSIASA